MCGIAENEWRVPTPTRLRDKTAMRPPCLHEHTLEGRVSGTVSAMISGKSYSSPAMVEAISSLPMIVMLFMMIRSLILCCFT